MGLGRKWFVGFGVLAAGIHSCTAVPSGGEAGDGPLPAVVAYNRDIRPILAENCFKCHGPDKNKRKADLRLDTQEGQRLDLGGYAAVVPLEPQSSELIRRIRSSDPDDRMPPQDSGKSLSSREIDLLTLWVQQGAPWEGHWAYQQPKHFPLPQVRTTGWIRQPVDRFILAGIDSRGLEPSPEADRRTLARRLAFDLTGLPVGPEEARAFQADPGPDVVERTVDRLLASPAYGQRMSVLWLDLVRYADSVGFHGDQPVNMYPYRDWVVAAFNANLPFDEFTVQQLAGDLLPNATLGQKVASGYNRLNRMSAEGGGQDKEYLAKYASDRVRATAGTWMGATLGCAECHNHKYDPYTTQDFYRFEAFFADITERGIYVGSFENGTWGPMLAVPTPDQGAETVRLNGELAQAEASLARSTPQLEESQARWEQPTRQALASWQVIRAQGMESVGKTELKVQEDGSLLVQGPNPDQEIFTLTFHTDGPMITGIRLEVLTHPTHGGAPGREGGGGNFVLTGLEVQVQLPAAQGQAPDQVQWRSVKISGAQADYSQKDFPVSAAIDEDPQTGWAVDGHTRKENREAVFTFAEPLAGGPATVLVVRAKHESKYAKHVLGRFRLSLTSVAEPPLVKLGGLTESVLELIRMDPAARNETQKQDLAWHYRTLAPELADVRRKADEARAALANLEKTIVRMPTTLAMAPRPIRVLPRGNWMDDSGPIVEPGVPLFMDQPASGSGRLGRLDLARWLVSDQNPTTSRVLANHLWKLFFGVAISRRLDDLGAQGDWPSHPELLDDLALRLKGSGWNVKRLARLIVTSAAYRQSSLGPAANLRADPENRLFSRQGRFRLEAEFVRDTALATSGLLVDRIGGPAAKPYQPPGYWSHLNFPVREWENSRGPDQYRRGLYTHWQRQYLHPAMAAFDAPGREECTADRTRSNTPLQALVLLNDPSYVEAARVLAQRIIRQAGPELAPRLDWAFRLVLARGPELQEAVLLEGIYRQHLAQYRADPKAGQELLAIGDAPLPKDMDSGDLAAMVSVTRVILNLHEAITRD